jgi:UDP-4-amino-4,6-dideoxy-N-acetyl-beta-L-altrosamine N-acetyltransferase
MPEKCTIRPVRVDDLPLLLTWRNHSSVRPFMLTQHEITTEEHANWFALASQDATRHLLLVEDGLTPIGYVQFTPGDSVGVNDWGFYAAPQSPKGSGRKLGRLALHHAFDVLGLHKVCGQALESNVASIVFHQRLGFKQEGLLRDQHLIGGTYHSLICFGLLACEWRSHETN